MKPGHEIAWRNTGNSSNTTIKGGDNLQFLVAGGGTASLILDTTNADFNSRNVINVGYFESNATNPASAGVIRLGYQENIYWRNNANTDDAFLGFGTQGVDTFSMVMNSQTEYEFGPTNFDIFGNAIRNASYFESNATNPATDGAIRLGTEEKISWRNHTNTADWYFQAGDPDSTFGLWNGATKFIEFWGTSEIKFQNKLLTGVQNIQLQGGAVIWRLDGANGTDIRVPTGALINLQVNDVDEYIFSSTQADFGGNNLVNVGYIESNASPTGTTGFIRMGNAEGLAWQIAAGTQTIKLDFTANDELELYTQGSNLAVLTLRTETPTPVNGTEVARLKMVDDNSVNAEIEYGSIRTVIETPTTLVEDAEMMLSVMKD
jgi:hypothetical protein